MNYLAHGLFLLDRPWALAGAALPDWLRVIDKKARLHPHKLLAHVSLDARESELLHGAIRHHDDDRAFHTDERFEELSDTITRALRARGPQDPRLRASAFGHIVAEMLLDAALMERDAALLDRYYDALADVDAELVAAFARRVTHRTLLPLPTLIDRFRASRFLDAYRTDDGLFDCVQGLCRRAGLPPPPEVLKDVITKARPLAADAAPALFSAR